MVLESCTFIAVLSLLLCGSRLEFGAAIDIITSSQPIKDPEAIVSAGNKFRLGFFSPGNSTNRYVGIWYNNVPVTAPVWVANRNKPLNDSSGIVTISDDGNLVVLNGQKEILWSSNVLNRVGNTSAQLTDDGNLVVRGSQSGNSLWQSFQEPSDTYLPKMKLSANARTGEKTLLTSWKGPLDPSIGSFSAGLNHRSIPEFFVWKDSRPIWRTGPWNGQLFIGVPYMNSVYLDGFNLVDDRNGIFSLSFGFANGSHITNFVLSSEGKFGEVEWDDGNPRWANSTLFPANECALYGKCGPFGICNPQNSPICSCLKGFEPKNGDEWIKGNWTSGCVRRTSLQCERIQNGAEVGRQDGFLKMEAVKVPDFAEWSSSATEQNCRDDCMGNCSCIAYSYSAGIPCMLWRGNLTDIQKFIPKQTTDRQLSSTDLYIRLAYSELAKKSNTNVIISTTVVAGSITIAVCVFFGWRWMAKYREGNISEEISLMKRKEAFVDENMIQDNLNQVKFQELPLFNLQKLTAATDNFHTANKLGQGGFGPVYKGTLPDGNEIAVKRLSRASGQGLEEFMNEVVVISKLQHRNLVRLIGCCVEGEEKVLVYEYMPNKSLDVFLFDGVRKELLDWRTRFNIIGGICRGLLYLHRDSRLRIIHRDLKASNILLDHEMNPKISDFGMARIFGGNEDQANTIRVVGTYGYMSPEYAMEGIFSEKSDVFSFGVLLLEIISGRRNSSFYRNDQALSLLRFAWKLWNEGNHAALVDSSISNPCQAEICRCIQIGLLCVQQFAKDRPAVSTVISMLNSEIMDLPSPKQPAFAERQSGLDSGSSHQNQNMDSINGVTFTILTAR